MSAVRKKKRYDSTSDYWCASVVSEVSEKTLTLG